MIGNSRTCSRRIYRPQEFNFTIKYELPTPLPPVARIWASRRVVTFRLLQRGPALAGQVIDSTRSIQFSMQRRTPLAAAAFLTPPAATVSHLAWIVSPAAHGVSVDSSEGVLYMSWSKNIQWQTGGTAVAASAGHVQAATVKGNLPDAPPELQLRTI